MKHDEPFTPDRIDEQVDQLSFPSLQESLLSNERVVQRLHALYEEDKKSTGRVWQRLEQHLVGHESSVQQVSSRSASLDSLPKERMRHKQQAPGLPGRTRLAWLSSVAAVLLTALLVGSLLLVLHGARSIHTGGAPANGQVTASPPGLYIVQQDEVSRLDVQTRKTIWQTRLSIKDPSRFAGTATVIGNTVYITSREVTTSSTLFALDARTGASLWSRTFDGSVATPYMADELITVQYIPVTMQGEGDVIYGLNPADGAIKVTYRPLQRGWNSPIVADGMLYYSYGSTLYALRVPGEKLLWQQTIQSKGQIALALYVTNGVVYAQSMFGDAQNNVQVYAFDAQTGKPIWQSSPIPGGVRTVTVIGDMVYVASFNHELYAFNAHTHTLVWRQPIDTYEMLVASGVLYLGYSNGADVENVLALRATDGKKLWQRNIVAGIPLVGVLDGVLYIIDWGGGKNGNGIVYALNAGNGSEIWHMPTGGDELHWNMTVA